MTKLYVDPFKKALASATPPQEPTSPPELPAKADLDIDSLLNRALAIVDRTLRSISIRTSGNGVPSRHDVMSLKDCVAMLQSLKESEKELLDKLSDEEIYEILEERRKAKQQP